MLFTNVGLAASGKLLLTAPATSVVTGSEFDVTIRVDTGTLISGVAADVSFNSSQLTFISDSEAGTAFPELWIQNFDTGSVSTIRSAGGNVSGNKVVVTYRFKAIAASGQTTISATGIANANNTELALSTGTLVLNITTTAVAATDATENPTTNSTVANSATSTTPSSNPATNVQNGATAGSQNQTANQAQDALSEKKKPGTLGIFSSNSPLSSSSSSSKVLLGAGGFSALALLGAGVWFGLRARRRSQNASHFPELNSMPLTTAVSPASDVVVSQGLSGQPVQQSGLYGNTTPSTSGPMAVNQQPAPSVIEPVVIQPQIVQPTVTNPSAIASVLPNIPTQTVVTPQGGVISPNETPKVG